MNTGTVKFFNATKGFGFIVSSTGDEFFVHITGLKSPRIQEGDNVVFNVIDGKKGLNAINVEVV